MKESEYKKIVIDPSVIYTPEKPISPVWRKAVIKESVPLNINQPPKTPYQARKEFVENMGI